jgi:NAD-dependent SIR2 family protein deacetylase
LTERETLSLDTREYSGGIGLWGAVPPVYDTTTLPLDRGVHVHARRTAEAKKVVDNTYRAVRVLDSRATLPPSGVVITELDAIYFMVSAVFGFTTAYIECTRCRWPHLDKDWFSVHAHKSHLCAGCGLNFRDDKVAIGNPATRVREAYRVRAPRAATGTCRLRQRDYRGGLRIWGSNPAIVWTGSKREEEGIHVHAFRGEGDIDPEVDGTYRTVEVDGVSLDPVLVRTLMAQSALPHISGRVMSFTCTACGTSHTDTGADAFTPRAARPCRRCKREVRSSGRLRNTIGNPLVDVIQSLGRNAIRPPQRHDLGLLPETL